MACGRVSMVTHNGSCSSLVVRSHRLSSPPSAALEVPNRVALTVDVITHSASSVMGLKFGSFLIYFGILAHAFQSAAKELSSINGRLEEGQNSVMGVLLGLGGSTTVGL
ncbi:hypothetical protein PAXRUDRAFT_829066 [Paxillus rubicundulus Ve08.2h10]|uniref:Uncharacterized protein n=1 Tax=Paxillus rubicundulus Ve08.2h10 TaxID=930991 RepID=A0A0D0E6K1_9AGAM|nr:hypothetical protein PAXRUDRAFT_829066 [Paxillus rubicundulus Ve08.2h10]